MSRTATKAADRLPSPEQAMERLMGFPAITLSDLAVLMGVGLSTVQRAAAGGTLDVPTARIGQRWVIPSAPVRKMLQLDDTAKGAA